MGNPFLLEVDSKGNVLRPSLNGAKTKAILTACLKGCNFLKELPAIDFDVPLLVQEISQEILDGKPAFK